MTASPQSGNPQSGNPQSENLRLLARMYDVWDAEDLPAV
ncbi:MAG: hypothetical protein QOI67_1340, partial [Gaiellaceae bacterium]|nr:hypothetical protein [Gaiellaceae bacterium]